MFVPSPKNNNHLRIIALGDITGITGRSVAPEIFSMAREKWEADLIIANGENASHGFGITPKHINELRSYGADLITLGNHAWDKHVLWHRIKDFDFIARPINMTRESPGSGYAVAETKFGKFAIINALGRLYMNPVNCPYHAVYDIVKKLKNENITMIGLDLHAETTAEKLIMGHFLDGKVSAIWGTHTHVPTADARILPKGTAYITDLGMTGALNSIIGFEIPIAIRKTVYGEPGKHIIETKGSRISSGIIVDINPKTGLAVSIQPFSQIFDEKDDLEENFSMKE